MNPEKPGILRGLHGAAFALPVFLAVTAVAVPASPAGLSASESRGKRIYTEGIGSGPVTAYLPGPGIRVQGRGFPYIQCHRADGKGMREGGVRAADITPFHLAKEYDGPRSPGRTHPPYTDAALRDAITNGRDPAGTPLATAHPRYAMGPEDMDDLGAYFKVLGEEPVPGIDPGEVRVGGLLPAAGPLVEAAADVESFLSGFFSSVNDRGGIYSRKVRFVPVRFDPGVPGAAASAARKIVEEGEIFCLVANLGVPVDGEAAGVLGRANVPVIAPLAVAPEEPVWTERNTFHVIPDFHDQARVMLDYAVDAFPREAVKVAIVHSADPAGSPSWRTNRMREERSTRRARRGGEGIPAPGRSCSSGAERRSGRFSRKRIGWDGAPGFSRPPQWRETRFSPCQNGRRPGWCLRLLPRLRIRLLANGRLSRPCRRVTAARPATGSSLHPPMPGGFLWRKASCSPEGRRRVRSLWRRWAACGIFARE